MSAITMVEWFDKYFFHLGVIKTKTPLGASVKCYNIERCICDIVLGRKPIDKQIFIDAMTGYFKGKDKKYCKL